MTDLVTLAQAQAFLQDATVASEALIQSCVDAASQAVIDFLGGDPSTQTRTELLSGQNTPFIYPNHRSKPAPITGLTSITINPGLTDGGCGSFWNQGLGSNTPSVVDLSCVSFDDASIIYTNGAKFPRGQRNLTVVYTSGYALTPTSGLTNIPVSITQATLYCVSAFYTAIGKELNATSESYSGVMSQGFAAGGPGGLPPAAKLLLSPYRILMFSP